MYSLILALLSIYVQLSNTIDAEGAQISFQFPAREVKGTIGELQSESNIDTLDFGNSTLKGSVSLESLKTGNFLRDWHLMSEKYFHRKKQDRIYFQSVRIGKKEEYYNVWGTLNIKGINESVEFKARVTDSGLELTGEINSSDWDIDILRERSANVVHIRMHLPYAH